MSKYDNLSKEDLLKLVEKQDKELASKKYGLVWDSEREPEQVVLDCANNLPVLKRVKGKEIKIDDSEDNILIEGDNYHALTVLNYTHKEKIDVIYIDPPYNTGAKDWKYNNNYVGEDDGYRHSKWLNMMEKRLNLAKELLKEDGIICVTIDDYELPNLWLLMNKIFGKENHLGTTVIRNNPKGRMTKRKVSLIHEYCLFFGASEKSQIKKIPEAIENKSHNYKQDKNGEWYLPINLRKQGVDSNAYNKKGELSDRYYPIYYDKETGKISTKESCNIQILPIDNRDNKRMWRRSKDVIDEMFEAGKIWVNEKKGAYQVYFKFIGGAEERLPQSMWIDAKYSASDYGTKILNEIFNQREVFDYPKSPFAIIDTIKICCNNKNATILDFFVGSGTTGHAVLEMNKEDGGDRKFILCTNNEGNICTDVTYPRIHNVIKGYKFKGKDKTVLFEKKLTFSHFKNIEDILEEVNGVIEKNKDRYDKIEKEFKDNTLKIIGVKEIEGKKEGLGGNLQYFKTSLIKKTKNQDQVKVNLTQRCTEMLCVKENIFNLEKDRQDYKIFFSNKKDKFLCVYYNFLDGSFNKFLKEIKKLKGKKIIYMFSIDNKVEKSLFAGVNNFTIEAIPQKILDVYKQLVKMNIPVKTDVIFLELNKAKVEIFNEKEKDAGARRLRIVLEKLMQKVAQNNGINILNSKGKEGKISTLNDKLKHDKIITHIEWEENRTYLAIGNHASHGEYDEYNSEQVENFYKHIQLLLNNFGI